MALYAQVGIKDIQTDKQVWVDEFNSIRANPVHRLVGKTFIGNTKDTNFWTETVTGSGTVTQATGSVVLATGATANSTAQYQTNQVAHWIPGMENTFRSVLRVSNTGSANNIRNWGAFNSTDGVFYQLDNTSLNIVTRKGGVDTVIPQGSWNGNGHGLTNSFTLDTNFHIWEIKYTYADTHYYIDHNIMHTIPIIGQPSVVVGTFDLPVTLQNNNSSGGTANVSMETGIAFISRTGNLITQTHYKHIPTGASTTVCKIGAGRIQDIVINNAGSGTVTIYDNTAGSGTTIAVISGTNQGPYPYNVQFNVGLTIVTSAAGWDLTVNYE